MKSPTSLPGVCSRISMVFIVLQGSGRVYNEFMRASLAVFLVACGSSSSPFPSDDIAQPIDSGFDSTWATIARADAPQITSSNFNLDLSQGPVITASRVIGLAGAYVPLAEGCEGEYSNTASPSVRVPYSLGKWDYDICLGFTNPGA